MWFRTDLRLTDNTALHTACQSGPTIALFICSPQQWKNHHDAPCKIDFWLRQLHQLSLELTELNIPLVCLEVDEWKNIPTIISRFCQKYCIQQVHANIEFGVNEAQRDFLLEKQLKLQHIPFQQYADRTLFFPGTIKNKNNQPFQVFTAFKKACYEQLYYSHITIFPKPNKQVQLLDIEHALAVKNPFQSSTSISTQWPAGENFAQQRLTEFVEHHVKQYDVERDFPALNHTSQLSPYLNAGILSVRQCITALSNYFGSLDQLPTGAQIWLDELLWREFYQHMLAGYPKLSKGKAFHAAKEPQIWRHAPDDLLAWQEGRTGFPIIDAAMRQLLSTGWMHNRLRMIVAMFLCKNLLIDWRHGEQWFMQHLIDGDLAANNGGWQWCASIGSDAVPYFRLFNPITQSKRFDPNGVFIRTWLPELAHLDDKQIHQPYAKSSTTSSNLQYPHPIVDLDMSRLRALDAYKR